MAFEAMKVDQLKVELAERGSTRSGRKAITDPAAPSACTDHAGGDRATVQGNHGDGHLRIEFTVECLLDSISNLTSIYCVLLLGLESEGVLHKVRI